VQAGRRGSRGSTGRPLKIHFARADDHRRYGGRCALRRPRSAAMRFRAVERGGARAGGNWVDVVQFDEPAFNPISTRSSAGASRHCIAPSSGPLLQDRGAHLLWLRHPRPISTGRGARRRVAANTSGSFPGAGGEAGSTRLIGMPNSHVPIELLGLLHGKDVCSARSTWRARAVETPEDVRRDDSNGRCASARRNAFPLPCTNCGMGAARPQPRQRDELRRAPPPARR